MNRTLHKKILFLVFGAVIAALYVVLTMLQNFLLPGSTTWAIQFRISEVLCVLALFTPAAIPGLTIGCLLFNLTYAQALPLDAPVGSAATLLACAAMYALRRIRIRDYPFLAMLMPALFNGVLVGWELTAYLGGGFPLNALYVALGELTVLLTLGTFLYRTIRRLKLDRRLFAVNV